MRWSAVWLVLALGIASLEARAETVSDQAVATNPGHSAAVSAKPCPQGVDDRSSELCAQWAAVDAARSATAVAQQSNAQAARANEIALSASGAAWAGFWLSLASVLFLIVTVVMTAITTRAAVKSAEAAMAAVEAQKAKVVLTDRKAYGAIDVSDPAEEHLIIDFKWVNVGARTALKVQCDLKADLRPRYNAEARSMGYAADIREPEEVLPNAEVLRSVRFDGEASMEFFMGNAKVHVYASQEFYDLTIAKPVSSQLQIFEIEFPKGAYRTRKIETIEVRLIEVRDLIPTEKELAEITKRLRSKNRPVAKLIGHFRNFLSKSSDA